MDIKQLLRFVTLAEEGSFTRASQILSVSQPSVSRSIQMLEENLGVTLFFRVGQAVELTPSGRALLPYAKTILNDRAKAIAAISDANKKAVRSIRVAFTGRTSAPYFRAFVDDVTANNPCIVLTVADGSFPSLMNRLREGEFDLAFGARDSYADLNGLIFEPLVKSYGSYAVRAQHPLAGKPVWSIEDLHAYNWIMLDEPPLEAAWRRVFETRGLRPPSVALYCSSAQMIHESLLASDLIAPMGSIDAADATDQGALTLRRDISGVVWDVGIFRRDDVAMTKALGSVMKSLRISAASLGGKPPPFSE